LKLCFCCYVPFAFFCMLFKGFSNFWHCLKISFWSCTRCTFLVLLPLWLYLQHVRVFFIFLAQLFSAVFVLLCAFLTFSSIHITSLSWFYLHELQIYLSIPDDLPETFSRCFAINIRRIKRAFDLSHFSLLGSY